MIGWWGAGRAQDRASSVSGPGTWPPLSPQPASFTLLQQQVLFIHPTLPLPPKTSPALFPPAHWQGRGVYRFMCLAENRTLPTLLCLAVLNRPTSPVLYSIIYAYIYFSSILRAADCDVGYRNRSEEACEASKNSEKFIKIRWRTDETSVWQTVQKIKTPKSNS